MYSAAFITWSYLLYCFLAVILYSFIVIFIIVSCVAIINYQGLGGVNNEYLFLTVWNSVTRLPA